MKNERVFFRNTVGFMPLSSEGFVASEGYMSLMNNCGHYFGEDDIINKINKNEDNYFDFSKTFIDIGSEFGVYSFGTNFNFFYMFEGNYTKLIYSEMNMLLKKREGQFKTYNILLSDKSEKIPYDGFCTKYSNVPSELYHSENEVNANALFLDYFNIENVGMIKIDTEGMEYQIIRGGIGTIVKNNYPPILFELWPVGHWGMTEEKFNKTKNLIEDLGYKILWEWGDWETHLAVKTK